MKKKKKDRSGGIGGVLFAALLSVMLGVLLSFVSLLNQPVQELTRIPEKPEPGKVYYLKGNVIDTPQWPAKAAQIQSGAPGSVAFTEGDLNAWAKQNLKPTPAAGRNEKAPVIRVTDFPNIRITDEDQLQVMMRVEAPLVKAGRPFTYQTFGQVTPEGFEPAKGWIGQAPLPLVNDLVFKYFASMLEVSENAGVLAQSAADTRIVIADDHLNVHR